MTFQANRGSHLWINWCRAQYILWMYHNWPSCDEMPLKFILIKLELSLSLGRNKDINRLTALLIRNRFCNNLWFLKVLLDSSQLGSGKKTLISISWDDKFLNQSVSISLFVLMADWESTHYGPTVWCFGLWLDICFFRVGIRQF